MSACNAGDLGSIPGLGISPGEGNGNPLQYSCLENPKDGILVGCHLWGCTESDMTEVTIAVILEPKKIKSVTVSIVSPSV